MYLVSKKGIAITAILLGAISAASFFVWFIPQDTTQIIAVSDFTNHLDGVKTIHQLLQEELDASFEDLQAGRISAAEYTEIAQTTSEQINSQIILLVQSKAPESWYQSYLSYIEALKAQNSIIRETIVAADIIDTQGAVEATLDDITALRVQMESAISTSTQYRP